VHVSRDVREPVSLLSVNPNASPQNKNNYSIFSDRFVHRDVRGAAIYQPAVDHAIQKLRAGACCVGPLVRSCLLVVLCAQTACAPHGWIDSPFCRGRMPTSKRRIRRRASRDCSASSGECAPVLFFHPLPNGRTFSPPLNDPKGLHTQTGKAQENTKCVKSLYCTSSWRDGILELERGVSHHTRPWFDDV